MRRLAGLLTSVLALALLLSASAQAGRPSKFVTGVSGVESSDSLALQRVSSANATFVQVVLDWAEIGPRAEPGGWHPSDPADPAYDWSTADEEVSAAVQAGLTPMVLVDRAPEWAQRCKTKQTVGTQLCEPKAGAFASFAKAAAARYSGAFQGLPRVRYWQALNEPNLHLFFNPQFRHGRPVSPHLYRTLLNAFYRAIKAVDRSNVVIAAGLGPVAVPHLVVGPMRFTRLLLCMDEHNRPSRSKACKGGVHFDIFDVHPYTTGGPTHKGNRDDVQIGDLAKLRSLLKAADRAGRIEGMYRHTPLWITEFSWDTNPPDPGALPMKLAARWTARAMFEAWRVGVDHFFWFSLRDDPAGPGYAQTVQSGLYQRGATVADDTPKLTLDVFRFPFVALPATGGFGFWGRTPTSGPGPVRIEVRDKKGGWRTVKTVHARASGLFLGRVKTRLVGLRSGLVRARYQDGVAVAFGMREHPDFYNPPFG